MDKVLGNLEPAALWNHFERICSIPHPSKKERKLAAYVRDAARSRGLESMIDKAGNVIVRKGARAGMENRRTVVLQAHLDMVPQKNSDVAHNFETDPIRPRVDGQVVRADGTTLGSDNGIGIAAILAILESADLPHGPIEALLTADEEAGMGGANGLKPGLLEGDILFNLDSEDEGEICIGCAGGMDVLARMRYQEKSPPKGSAAFRVSVSGLRGGHSGVDIHLGRANANKILDRILWEARRGTALRIARWEGGDLRNAIPRDATALVVMPAKDANGFRKKAQLAADVIREEFRAADPALRVTVEGAAVPSKTMDVSTTDRLLNALYACPHGAFAMLRDMPGVTETSNNLAIVRAGRGTVSVTNMLRSSVETRKTDVANMIRSVFEMAGAEVRLSASYPGWQPNTDSPVLRSLQGIYRRMFGKVPSVTATHGGLECGIIRSVYPSMDAVSFGPTIRFPHSPDEHVDIPSVKRFWDFLIETLKEIPAR